MCLRACYLTQCGLLSLVVVIIWSIRSCQALLEPSVRSRDGSGNSLPPELELEDISMALAEDKGRSVGAEEEEEEEEEQVRTVRVQSGSEERGVGVEDWPVLYTGGLIWLPRN